MIELKQGREIPWRMEQEDKIYSGENRGLFRLPKREGFSKGGLGRTCSIRYVICEIFIRTEDERAEKGKGRRKR